MNKIILSALFALFVFASCDITEEFYNEGDEVYVKKVYLRFENTATERFGSVSTETFNLVTGIGGTALITEDVTVNIAVDYDYLAAYNAKNSTSYLALPADFLAEVPTQAVIKAGDQGALLTFVLSSKATEENSEINNYVLPVTISSVTEGYLINDGDDDDPDLNLSYVFVQFSF
jgi:hypothetical protein